MTAPTLAPPVAPAQAPAGYRHEAYVHRGPAELLERAVRFVRDALDAGEPVMVALVDERWLPLRDALGDDADRVRHVDMGDLGRNPARLLPAWTAFVAEHRGSGRPLRGLAEPVRAGRGPAEVAECLLHEALLDVAVDPRTPLRLLCTYDVEALGADVVAEAVRRHGAAVPTGATPAEHLADAGAHARDLWRRALPPAPPGARSLPVEPGDLALVRAGVREAATAAGLEPTRVDDLVLAVNELAANSVDHGGGRGVLRLWTEPDAFLCEVQDAGRLDDVLVGRVLPTVDQPRGRGVWMVNQLCDLVQIRSSSAGTVVRVHSRLGCRPVR